MFKTPILMLKMKFFWLIFRGKFEQKTQKSIFLKNQWRLKNIKKAMVVKNIIAEDMPFTKSIFEQFWRSYCKKTIFVVFHFLKFLPNYIRAYLFLRFTLCWQHFSDHLENQVFRWPGASLCIQIPSYTIWRPTGI